MPRKRDAGRKKRPVPENVEMLPVLPTGTSFAASGDSEIGLLTFYFSPPEKPDALRVITRITMSPHMASSLATDLQEFVQRTEARRAKSK